MSTATELTVPVGSTVRITSLPADDDPRSRLGMPDVGSEGVVTDNKGPGYMPNTDGQDTEHERLSVTFDDYPAPWFMGWPLLSTEVEVIDEPVTEEV